MSRIHDALKRAEQERATAMGTHIEPAAGSQPEVASATMPPLQSSVDSAMPGAIVLNYETLLARCPQTNWTPDERTMLFFQDEDESRRGAEEFRTLRSRLYQIREKLPIKRILITSSLPKEGKSFTAANLAQVLARQHGRRALVIDADLRNPELSRRLSSDANHGLLELMAGSMSLSQVTRVVSGERLWFLPAIVRQRIANSGDLLGSERMRNVLAAARPRFHQLIIDLPPLGPVSDARAISPLVDAFILVVNWGYTRFDVLDDALAHFGVAGDKIIGVVLNKVNFHELRNLEASSQGYYYNKHYARYGYTFSDH